MQESHRERGPGRGTSLLPNFEVAEHLSRGGRGRGSGNSVHSGEQNDAGIVGGIKNDGEAVGCSVRSVSAAGGAGFGKSGTAGKRDVDRARCALLGGLAHAREDSRVAIARVPRKGGIRVRQRKRRDLPAVREAGEGERLVRGVYRRKIVAGEDRIGVVDGYITRQGEEIGVAGLSDGDGESDAPVTARQPAGVALSVADDGGKLPMGSRIGGRSEGLDEGSDR